MGVKLSMEWSYLDLQTIILENEMLRLVILPELGAKLWKLIYKPENHDLLWNHPRIKPKKLPLHSVYDDHFYGGWDELYPNDIPETVNGEPLPDHGEIWTLPWEYRVEKESEEEIILYLWVETPVTSSRVEKWISLKSNESQIHFHHKITNTGQKEQPYLWKLHAAMKVNEHTKIDMGAKKVYIEDFGPPRNGKTGVTYDWPFIVDEAGKEHDMRNALPSTSGVNEFQYGLELEEGWCSVTDTQKGLGMGLSFDRNVFPSCWLFATYGGWRNLQTVVLEPCTGYPVSVNDGIEKGTHRMLAPGEVIETDVTAIVCKGTVSPFGNK